jgi:hypothetical protein
MLSRPDVGKQLRGCERATNPLKGELTVLSPKKNGTSSDELIGVESQAGAQALAGGDAKVEETKTRTVLRMQGV